MAPSFIKMGRSRGLLLPSDLLALLSKFCNMLLASATLPTRVSDIASFRLQLSQSVLFFDCFLARLSALRKFSTARLGWFEARASSPFANASDHDAVAE